MNRLVAALLLPAVLLSGCAGLRPREADRLLVVQTVGWDTEGETQILSLSVPRDDARGGPVRLTGRGPTVLSALRDARQTAPREELFYAHIRFAAVGENAARQGLQPLLDAMERSPQTRLDVPLLIVRGGEARALVTGGDDADSEITSLLDALVREAEREGAPRVATVLETARSLAEDGAALCCAAELFFPGADAPSAKGAPAARAAGSAVLKNGRLVGFLEPEAAAGAALFTAGPLSLPLALPVGDAEVTVRLLRCRVRTEALFDGEGRPLLRVRLTGRGALAEQDGPAVDTAEIEARLSDALRSMAEAALRSSRTLETDFLRLCRLWDGEALRRAGIDGAEALLQALVWEVDAEARLERPYDLRRAVPLRAGEGGAP